MKLAIDIFPLESGHASRGMGFYTKKLVEALKKEGEKTKTVKVEEFNFRAEKRDLSEYDVVHVPYFDLFFRTLRIVHPRTVVTVADVIPLIYPKNYPPGVRGKISFLRQKRELKKARAIITISETSKKDIVRFLDIPQERVFSIHLAPGNAFVKQEESKLRTIREKYKLPDKYILYVGDINYNKNIINLVSAVKLAGYKLVIVGKQSIATDYDKSHIENVAVKELQEKYGNDSDVLRLGYIDEGSDFFGIWQMTEVYCQPSLYEGFGLPVLEAFTAGVPVVCSKIQALVEIADDAAVYFDPNDVHDIADKLKLVVRDKQLRKELVDRGIDRVKQFSWEKTAKKTIGIYQSMIND